MVKKIGETKTGKIIGTRVTDKLKESSQVDSVNEVTGPLVVSGPNKITGVGSGKRRPTRELTTAEREELFRIINEEAEKLFAGAKIPDKDKEVVKEAVKMAVDSGLLDGEEE